MTRNDGVRLAIVGCGGIGRAYAQAIATCPEIAVTAVCDSRRQAAEALARDCGAQAFTRHEEVEGIEAVLIATPPISHANLAVHFAQQGVAVLGEKPFTLDLGDAARVLRAARQGGARLAMASKFRCVGEVVEAKRLLDSGTLGTPLAFENAFTSFVEMKDRWNADAAVSGGGVLIDNGSHALDLARWFIGPLAEIQVSEGARPQGLDVEETVHVEARSRSGVRCGSDLSWSLDRGSDTYLRLSGSDGIAVVGWRGSRWRRHGGEWISFGSGYDKSAALRTQLTHFAAAVRGESAPLVTPLEAAASVSAVAAGYASLRSGAWTPVVEFEPAELGHGQGAVEGAR